MKPFPCRDREQMVQRLLCCNKISFILLFSLSCAHFQRINQDVLQRHVLLLQIDGLTPTLLRRYLQDSSGGPSDGALHQLAGVSRPLEPVRTTRKVLSTTTTTVLPSIPETASATILTGLLPRYHGVRSNDNQLPPKVRTLFDVLAAAGLHSVAAGYRITRGLSFNAEGETDQLRMESLISWLTTHPLPALIAVRFDSLASALSNTDEKTAYKALQSIDGLLSDLLYQKGKIDSSELTVILTSGFGHIKLSAEPVVRTAEDFAHYLPGLDRHRVHASFGLLHLEAMDQATPAALAGLEDEVELVFARTARGIEVYDPEIKRTRPFDDGESDYPELSRRLLALTEIGDVVALPRRQKGFVFSAERRGPPGSRQFGGATSEESLVPLLFSGESIPASAELGASAVRLESLAATIAHWLGVSPTRLDRGAGPSAASLLRGPVEDPQTQASLQCSQVYVDRNMKEKHQAGSASTKAQQACTVLLTESSDRRVSAQAILALAEGYSVHAKPAEERVLAAALGLAAWLDPLSPRHFALPDELRARWPRQPLRCESRRGVIVLFQNPSTADKLIGELKSLPPRWYLPSDVPVPIEPCQLTIPEGLLPGQSDLFASIVARFAGADVVVWQRTLPTPPRIVSYLPLLPDWGGRPFTADDLETTADVRDHLFLVRGIHLFHHGQVRQAMGYLQASQVRREAAGWRELFMSLQNDRLAVGEQQQLLERITRLFGDKITDDERWVLDLLTPFEKLDRSGSSGRWNDRRRKLVEARRTFLGAQDSEDICKRVDPSLQLEQMRRAAADYESVGNVGYAARALFEALRVQLWIGATQSPVSDFGLAPSLVAGEPDEKDIELRHLSKLLQNPKAGWIVPAIVDDLRFAMRSRPSLRVRLRAELYAITRTYAMQIQRVTAAERLDEAPNIELANLDRAQTIVSLGELIEQSLADEMLRFLFADRDRLRNLITVPVLQSLFGKSLLDSYVFFFQLVAPDIPDLEKKLALLDEASTERSTGQMDTGSALDKKISAATGGLLRGLILWIQNQYPAASLELERTDTLLGDSKTLLEEYRLVLAATDTQQQLSLARFGPVLRIAIHVLRLAIHQKQLHRDEADLLVGQIVGDLRRLALVELAASNLDPGTVADISSLEQPLTLLGRLALSLMDPEPRFRAAYQVARTSVDSLHIGPREGPSRDISTGLMLTEVLMRDVIWVVDAARSGHHADPSILATTTDKLAILGKRLRPREYHWLLSPLSIVLPQLQVAVRDTPCLFDDKTSFFACGTSADVHLALKNLRSILAQNYPPQKRRDGLKDDHLGFVLLELLLNMDLQSGKGLASPLDKAAAKAEALALGGPDAIGPNNRLLVAALIAFFKPVGKDKDKEDKAAWLARIKTWLPGTELSKVPFFFDLLQLRLSMKKDTLDLERAERALNDAESSCPALKWQFLSSRADILAMRGEFRPALAALDKYVDGIILGRSGEHELSIGLDVKLDGWKITLNEKMKSPHLTREGHSGSFQVSLGYAFNSKEPDHQRLFPYSAPYRQPGIAVGEGAGRAIWLALAGGEHTIAGRVSSALYGLASGLDPRWLLDNPESLDLKGTMTTFPILPDRNLALWVGTLAEVHGHRRLAQLLFQIAKPHFPDEDPGIDVCTKGDPERALGLPPDASLVEIARCRIPSALSRYPGVSDFRPLVELRAHLLAQEAPGWSLTKVTAEQWNRALRQTSTRIPSLVPPWAAELEAAVRLRDPARIPAEPSGAATVAASELGQDYLEQAPMYGYGCEALLINMESGLYEAVSPREYIKNCADSMITAFAWLKDAELEVDTDLAFASLKRALSVLLRLKFAIQNREQVLPRVFRVLSKVVSQVHEFRPFTFARRAQELAGPLVQLGDKDAAIRLRALAIALSYKLKLPLEEQPGAVIRDAVRMGVRTSDTAFLKQMAFDPLSEDARSQLAAKYMAAH